MLDSLSQFIADNSGNLFGPGPLIFMSVATLIATSLLGGER